METLQQELVFLDFEGLSLEDETLIKDALSAGSELVVFPWESGDRPLEKVPFSSTTSKDSITVTQTEGREYYEPVREYVTEIQTKQENGPSYTYRAVTEAYSPAQVSPHYPNVMYQPVGLSYPASIAMVSAQPNAYVSNIATSINVGGLAAFPPQTRPIMTNMSSAKRISHSPHKRNKPYLGGVNGHMQDQYTYANPIPFNTQPFFAPPHPTAQNLTGIPYYMQSPYAGYHSGSPYVIPAPAVASAPTHYTAAVVTPETTVASVEPHFTPESQAEENEVPEVVFEKPPPSADVPEDPVSTEAQPEPVIAEAVVEPVTEVEGESEPTQEEPVIEDAQPQQKTWASLFKSAASGLSPSNIKLATSAETSVPSSSNTLNAGVKIDPPVAAPVTVDAMTQQLARHLVDYALVHSSVALLPRGLTNKNNWCYINASLQALLACPPFVHLIKSLSKWAGSRLGESPTPIMDSLVEFIGQFETIHVRSRKDRAAKKEELTFGSCFEPTSILRMLSNIRSETFKVEGRQEDAEEFLSCLLNGLHDEMVEVLKHAPSTTATSTPTAAPNGDLGTSLNGDDEWQLIGPKNRSCVTRSAIFNKTPISDLFLGQMRSALYQSGSQATATLQPFFSLQLDIQSERVQSVREALEALVTREPLTGYVCSKTGQEVEASRQTTLEELPPILMLHLKCFVYDKSGGCQKLLKRIEFSADLELGKELLSPNQKSKVKERQRHYKLFAVVYHDGKEATKGHYVTEVLHTGLKTWLRFDDSLIKQVADGSLFQYNLPRMPYLLFYRRADTFSGPAAAPASTSPAVSSSRGGATKK